MLSNRYLGFVVQEREGEAVSVVIKKNKIKIKTIRSSV